MIQTRISLYRDVFLQVNAIEPIVCRIVAMYAPTDNFGSDKELHPLKMWDEISYHCPNLNGAAIEVWEGLSNFIPHLIAHGITYPYSDQNQSMLLKEDPGK